jgi:dCTP deaminase
MILTGPEIRKEMARGVICIAPFREDCVQPNNYDFHLGTELFVYDEDCFNQRHKFMMPKKVVLPSSGYTLLPDTLYLGITEEITASTEYAQLLFGDHSIGSLGVWVQITAPLAHVGSKIRWTLEIKVLKPTVVYPGMKFGKICFLKNLGTILEYGSDKFWNSGRYTENELTESRIFLDLPLEEL